MAEDRRNKPPCARGPSLFLQPASTSSTLVGVGPPTASQTLQGSQPLTKVCSQRLGSAEGMLAQASRGAEGGATEEDAEKAVATDGEEAWTFPEGGRGWVVVFACFCFASCQTMNGSSFVAGRLGDRFGFKRMIAIGACCTFASLVVSAFVSHSLPLLFVFQGAILGFSQGIGMPLFMSLPSQWFLEKRGLATGLATSGSGIGGGIASLIMRALLPKVGYRNTMLIYAGINATVCFIAWNLLAERAPPLKQGQSSRVPKRWLPHGIWGNRSFYSLSLCFGIGIFGYLTPYYYITAFTTLKCPELDATSIAPAVPLIIANFMSGLGRIFAGRLADHIGPVNSLFLSFFLGGLFQLVFWPFVTRYGPIIAFMTVEGFVGSWFLSLLPVAAAQLFGLEGLATIVGFIVLVNSPGQFLGATVSGVVLTSSGGDYQAVAFFAGACMLAGGICLLYARFANERRILAKF